MNNINPKWGDWAIKPPSIADSEIKASLSCDVAILGAGISGVTCALRAAQNGLKVVVLEKFSKWSGRGGNIGVVSSSYLKERGYENDVDAVAREWIKRCGNRCDEEILWLFLKNGCHAMDWLMEIMLRPEYNNRPDLQASLYVGETYREIYGSHRFFDGPMARKGMRPGASDAIYAMYNEALKLGVKFLFNCPACEIIKVDERVSGVIGKSEDGYIKVNAAKGVVIATGDIGGNDEMCQDLAPLANRATTKIYTPKGGNTGDGHRLGLWAGGAFEDDPFPLMLHPQAFHFANYCFLFVDKKGRRFMNEDNYIQGKSIAMLRRNMKFAWSILDADWREKIPATLPYGGGIFWEQDHSPTQPRFDLEGAESLMRRGTAAGHIVEADTLEELAEKMDVPVEEFVATVKRYNANVAKGHDDDFGKRPELLMGIDKPPYYGLKFGPALLAVVGGLKVGTRMDVLDGENEPIEGLYAIGNAAGGRYGVDYPMLLPGNSHGTALTFGYILGDILADKALPEMR